MPIYEYECEACGGQEEHIQGMSDPPVRTCRKCKKKALRRLISSSAFHLKGGGWYKDGYASTGKGGSGGGEKASADRPAAPAGGEKASADKPAAPGGVKASAEKGSSSTGGEKKGS